MDIDQLEQASEDNLFPYRGDMHGDAPSPVWSLLLFILLVLIGVLA